MIETRLLRSFATVADELHFGAAARRLNIAQPALSRQIQQLEARLGVTLLDRTARRVSLTAAGRAFLARARRVLADLDEAAAEARRVAEGQEGAIRVGFIHSSTYGIAPQIIRHFREHYPLVVLDLHEMPIDQQLAALLDGTIDVGILRPPLADPRLATRVLAEERFVIALPRGHPLAERERVTLRALAGERFILFTQERSPLFYERIQSMCQAAGFTPDVQQHATQIHTMVGLVAAGIGIAILPEVARNLHLPGVAFCAIEENPAAVEVALGWRTSDTNPALAAFLAVTDAESVGRDKEA
ncbi:LysR family transcriptional regulator [Acuticoccus sp. M5D2P5]|uniref:LysR family transcriptional regulator n=1 Tax=Acuticoccus kalidii TaxID=2910977 RepID=UPI001F2B1246|nr:LysR family transcriptional regulator [Acuticoccus kalidii]MCF3933775.1 LysR family transcriptional regulator [Acuticoccus kalidii]